MAVGGSEERGDPCLVLKGLSKNFGGLHALSNLDLIAYPGDRLAIIGPNGAGKTTLFELITGVFPPTRGQILLFQRDVTRWPTHRRIYLGMGRRRLRGRCGRAGAHGLCHGGARWVVGV